MEFEFDTLFFTYLSSLKIKITTKNAVFYFESIYPSNKKVLFDGRGLSYHEIIHIIDQYLKKHEYDIVNIYLVKYNAYVTHQTIQQCDTLQYSLDNFWGCNKLTLLPQFSKKLNSKMCIYEVQYDNLQYYTDLNIVVDDTNIDKAIKYGLLNKIRIIKTSNLTKYINHLKKMTNLAELIAEDINDPSLNTIDLLCYFKNIISLELKFVNLFCNATFYTNLINVINTFPDLIKLNIIVDHNISSRVDVCNAIKILASNKTINQLELDLSMMYHTKSLGYSNVLGYLIKYNNVLTSLTVNNILFSDENDNNTLVDKIIENTTLNYLQINVVIKYFIVSYKNFLKLINSKRLDSLNFFVLMKIEGFQTHYFGYDPNSYILDIKEYLNTIIKNHYYDNCGFIVARLLHISSTHHNDEYYRYLQNYDIINRTLTSRS